MITMPVRCYLENGNFIDAKQADIKNIAAGLDGRLLYETPVQLLVKLLARFGKELTRTLVSEEGVLYLATWLRASNLNNFLALNLGDSRLLDSFQPTADGRFLRAQPRGLVCHWIAGNIPTLAIFSLVQSILCKNTNLMRLPEPSIAGTLALLKVLAGVEVEEDGRKLSGRDLLRAVSVVHFPSSDAEANREMSLAADCKVIWGGHDAVRSILTLPQREHCEPVIFGPKYSFAVIDEASITPELCRAFALDIITFEQNACSSPHVIFCETARKDGAAARLLADGLAAAFTALAGRFPKPPGGYSAILNARGIYWLDPDKDIRCSEALDWSVLIDSATRLEEPVGNRTIFVKEVARVEDVLPLVTKKIQTVGIALADEGKRKNFCEEATFRGVSRCVPPGMMNDYATPWDGILFMHRLVRWTSMR